MTVTTRDGIGMFSDVLGSNNINKGGRCLLSQMCESGIRAHVCYDLILIFLIGFSDRIF